MSLWIKSLVPMVADDKSTTTEIYIYIYIHIYRYIHYIHIYISYTLYTYIYILYIYIYILYIYIYILYIYIYMYIYIYQASPYEACDRTRARLRTCLKHWRRAKKCTSCLIKKASRRVADRTSKTTTFFIFHFLWNIKILRENHVYLFVISLVHWWKLYCQKQPPEVFCLKRCS